MTEGKRIRGLILAASLLLASEPRVLAQPGQSGMAFLKLGVSGRGTAMADAGSASSSGAAATYYNPAGLVNAEGIALSPQLMFMHREWIQDTRMEFLGASVPLGMNDAFGVSINSTTVSDIEVRTRPGPPDGTFTSRQVSAAVSYAHRLADDLRAGVTAKFLYQKIFVDEQSGVAADLGAIWKTPLESLAVGASLSNLGSMGVLRQERTILPALLRIGPAYSFLLNTEQMGATVALDFVRILPEKRNYLDAGTEVTLTRAIAVRGGYQFGSEGRGLTLGAGIAYGLFALDYAYARISSDLGDAHTVSLSLNF